MLMLRAKQPNIQFEAFHVLKVFVANPVRSGPAVCPLSSNSLSFPLEGRVEHPLHCTCIRPRRCAPCLVVC